MLDRNIKGQEALMQALTSRTPWDDYLIFVLRFARGSKSLSKGTVSSI